MAPKVGEFNGAAQGIFLKSPDVISIRLFKG